MTHVASFCRIASIASAILVLFCACGSGSANKTVSAANVDPADAHIIIFQRWRDSDRRLELQVQLRRGGITGEMLQFDSTDSLVVAGRGALDDQSEIDATDNEATFTPNGLHYNLVAKDVDNAPMTLQWFRSGSAIASVMLSAVGRAAFKSYEYCHAVLGQNYALVRFEGDAPAANESVCARVMTDCAVGSCSEVANSCMVHDYRVQIPETDDELSQAASLNISVQRTTTIDSLPGFKSAQYERRYDSGRIDSFQDTTCVKPI